MKFEIRPYHCSDLLMYYQICLKTGDSGKDASELYRNPELLGHFYAAPYPVFEPDISFTLTAAGNPCGYIIGTTDSAAFYANCEKDWFPVLRERFPLPPEEDLSLDAHMIRLIHKGHLPNPDLAGYPAHLHIDLLPIAQGHGLGRKLMQTFINTLQKKNVSALHLQVGIANSGAIRFYESVGFNRIAEYEKAIAFGIKF